MQETDDDFPRKLPSEAETPISQEAPSISPLWVCFACWPQWDLTTSLWTEVKHSRDETSCYLHHHNTFCSKQKLDWVQHQKWVSGYQERTNSPQGFIFSSGPASVSLFNQSHTDCLPGLPAFTGNNWRFPQLNWFRLIAIDKVHFDFQKSWCEAGGRVRLYPTLSVIVIGH